MKTTKTKTPKIAGVGSYAFAEVNRKFDPENSAIAILEDWHGGALCIEDIVRGAAEDIPDQFADLCTAFEAADTIGEAAIVAFELLMEEELTREQRAAIFPTVEAFAQEATS